MFRDRSQFEQGINHYVPAMQFSHAISEVAPQQFSLGAPAANAVIQAGILANSAIGTIVQVNAILPEKYGRTLIFTPSADPGASGGQIDWRGFDYLGQPILERISGTNGSTTPVVGKKAFKRVSYSRIVTTSTNGITWSITSGDSLGLPYRGELMWVRENGVNVAIAGFTAPDMTDPATAATGDPRGTWNPAAAFDGIKEYVACMIGNSYVNAAGNGGLHGIRQYFA